MHGARGGAPTGKKNGNYRHGANTKAFRAEVDSARELIATANQTLASLNTEDIKKSEASASTNDKGNQND